MRTFLICAVLLFIAFWGYAYSKNPAGCRKIARDIVAVVESVSPVKLDLIPKPKPKPPLTADEAAVASVLATASNPTTTAPVEPASPAPEIAPAKPAVPELPPLPPFKKWTAPDPLPAHTAWLWTTASGKTYQDVVITAIKPDSVSINHSLGAATIPMDLLTPDLQKELNYDPDAAASAKVESEREIAHPYYPVTALAEAQRVARQMHWPLAWMDTTPEALKAVNPSPGSDDELSQMALNFLKTQSVVIFVNANVDLGALSPIIRDGQLFQMDDGPLPGGHHFYAPKIVFSDASVTKAFGRVSHTQMAATREAAIESVLESITKDPEAQALLNGDPSNPSIKSP